MDSTIQAHPSSSRQTTRPERPPGDDSGGVVGPWIADRWTSFTDSFSSAPPAARRRLMVRLFGGLLVALGLMAGTAWALDRRGVEGPLPGDAATVELLRGFMPVTMADSLTPLGGTLLLLPLTLVLAAIFARRARPDRSLILVVTFFAAKAITKVGWTVWTRERPDGVGAEAFVPSAPSFPSGHALQAAAIWTLLGVWWARSTDSTAERLVAAVSTVLVVVVTAATRIRLEAHYASDVWAALAFGGVWVAIALWAERGFATAGADGRGGRA